MKKKKAAKRKPTKALRKKIATVVRAGLKPLMRLDLKKAASKIPDDIKTGNFGPDRGESFIRLGRYVMRNHSCAVITASVTLKFGIQGRQTWQGWKGYLDGHPDGEKLVWGLDGKRSDAAPLHEHDILHRSKNQKGI